MKISMASLALAMLAEIAVARNCDYEYNYCGATLNKIGTVLKPFHCYFVIADVIWHLGNYQSEMEEACTAAGTSCKGERVNDFLFDCVPGFTNSIKVMSDCASGGLPNDVCADGGAGKSDYCDF
jgi:hypothetical protein